MIASVLKKKIKIREAGAHIDCIGINFFLLMRASLAPYAMRGGMFDMRMLCQYARMFHMCVIYA